MSDPYNEDLPRNPANFQPLTPLTFLERAASVFPQHTAIIHGNCAGLTLNFTRGRASLPRPSPSIMWCAATLFR